MSVNRFNKNKNIKEKRVLSFLKASDYDAAVIGRRDNFAWLTCGGNNSVLLNSEFGVCLIIITEEKKIVIANTMDGQRIIDEELKDQDYELIELKWYENSIEETAINLLKDKEVISDISLPGFDCKQEVFVNMHYPFTSGEVDRYRWLAKNTEEVIRETAREIKPGMSEEKIKNILIKKFAERYIDTIVVLVGSDERIKKYRHPVPTAREVERYVMLAPAVQKWGLTVPITRMIYFGKKIPQELAEKYDALCKIEANTIASCEPGNKFIDINKMQKELYQQLGYPEEWKKHFMGGITGYIVNDPAKCFDSKAKIEKKQSFNWYLTISGAKVEETVLSGKEEKEILTENGLWPVKEYEAKDQKYRLPQIMVR